MLIVQVFLAVSISVATANVIVDSKEQYSSAAAVQVKCGGKVCKNGATCKTGNQCVCKTGTKGNECEVVIGCETLKEKCDKINTECIFDTDLYRATCKCNDEKKGFNGSSCVDCSCGEFVQRCVFSDSTKYCFCKKGYADKFGTCSPCSCGEGEERCDFFKDEKNCMCKEGYKEKAGMCASCSCGVQTKTCSFINGDRYCICNEGYKFKFGTCEECNCGGNSTSCLFDDKDGAKVCYCKEGNWDKLGTCTTCDCGPDTTCKYTKTGEKNCVCIGERCREPGTPWFKNPVVIVCILVLCGTVISIGSFVAYRKLRR